MKKHVLITGAARGIGEGISEAFKNNGWNVIGVDLNEKDDENFYSADVSSTKDLEKIFVFLKEKEVTLNCVINNAAVQVEKDIISTTFEEWTTVIATNLNSVFYTTKIFFPLFKETSIINISSIHAKITSKTLASYVASKGGISSLTRAMALELAEYNIRVNSISPGAIDTPMLRKGLGRNSDEETALSNLIETTPLKKLGTPQEIAQIALFLADNNKSGNITGSDFPCDGGVGAKLASE